MIIYEGKSNLVRSAFLKCFSIYKMVCKGVYIADGGNVCD